MVINGEEYSILSAPHPTSALVKAAEEKLTSNLDLKKPVSNLTQTEEFVKIACIHCVAPGDLPTVETQKCQKQIKSLGFEIKDLCGRSAVTMVDFESAMQSILQDQVSMCKLLVDGHEDQALDNVLRCSKLAKEMARRAEQLRDDFERRAGEV